MNLSFYSWDPAPPFNKEPVKYEQEEVLKSAMPVVLHRTEKTPAGVGPRQPQRFTEQVCSELCLEPGCLSNLNWRNALHVGSGMEEVTKFRCALKKD